jgi:hypothetical protein
MKKSIFFKDRYLNILSLFMQLLILLPIHSYADKESLPPKSSDQWTDWQTLDNTQKNGIEFYWKRGELYYGSGSYEICEYQFSNHYPQKVKVTYEITYTMSGEQRVVKGYYILNSGETSSPDCAWVIGKRIDSVQYIVDEVNPVTPP